jgi:hypothetical protein
MRWSQWRSHSGSGSCLGAVMGSQSNETRNMVTSGYAFETKAVRPKELFKSSLHCGNHSHSVVHRERMIGEIASRSVDRMNVALTSSSALANGRRDGGMEGAQLGFDLRAKKCFAPTTRRIGVHDQDEPWTEAARRRRRRYIKGAELVTGPVKEPFAPGLGCCQCRRHMSL